ncbi:MAG: hypothetical protein LUO95_07665 [Methylococcaceae bacterium]|nr:hypothetical protein [Methylococcaceae bacterium]
MHYRFWGLLDSCLAAGAVSTAFPRRAWERVKKNKSDKPLDFIHDRKTSKLEKFGKATELSTIY